MFRRMSFSGRGRDASPAASPVDANADAADNASIRSRTSFGRKSRSRSSSVGSKVDSSGGAASVLPLGKVSGPVALDIAAQLPIVPAKPTRASLQKAIVAKDADLETLVRKKLDKLNKTDDNNKKAAIHYCAVHGNIQALRTLLKAAGGAVAKPNASNQLQINLADGDGRTALHYAVLSGNLAFTREVLQHHGDVNVIDGYGYTPLHYAIYANSLPILHNLLERDADLSVLDVLKRASYLHHAVEQNTVDAAKVFLQYSHPVDAADPVGRTPLHIACLATKPNGDMIRLLCLNQANPSCPDNSGNTPQQHLERWQHAVDRDATATAAAKSDALQLVELVMRKSAEIEARGGNAKSPKKSFADASPKSQQAKSRPTTPLRAVREETAVESISKDDLAQGDDNGVKVGTAIDYAGLMDDISTSDISVDISEDESPKADDSPGQNQGADDESSSVVSFDVSKSMDEDAAEHDDDSLSDILKLEQDEENRVGADKAQQEGATAKMNPINSGAASISSFAALFAAPKPPASETATTTASPPLSVQMVQAPATPPAPAAASSQATTPSSPSNILSLVESASDIEEDAKYADEYFDKDDEEVPPVEPAEVAAPLATLAAPAAPIKKSPSDPSDDLLSLCASKDESDSEDVSELSDGKVSALVSAFATRRMSTADVPPPSTTPATAEKAPPSPSTAAARLPAPEPTLQNSVLQKSASFASHHSSSLSRSPSVSQAAASLLRRPSASPSVSLSRSPSPSRLVIPAAFTQADNAQKPTGPPSRTSPSHRNSLLLSAVDEGVLLTPATAAHPALVNKDLTSLAQSMGGVQVMSALVQQQQQPASGMKTSLSVVEIEQRASLANKDAELKNLRDRVWKLEEDAEELRREHARQLIDRDRMHAQAVKAAQAEQSAEISRLADQLSQAKRDGQAATAQLRDAEVEHVQLRTTIRQQQETAVAQDAKIKTFEEQMHTIMQRQDNGDGDNPKIAALQAQLQNRDAQLQSLEAQLGEMRHQHDDEVAELKRARAEQDELVKTRVEQIEFLTSQIHYFTARISRTTSRAQTPTMTHMAIGLDQDGDERDRNLPSDLLVSKLQQASASTQQLYADVEEMDRAMRRYEHFYVEALTARQTYINSVQSQLDTARQELEELCEEHQEAQTRIATLNDLLTTSNMTIHALSNEKRDMQEHMTQMEEDCSKRVEHQQQERDVLQQELEELRQTTLELRKQLVERSNLPDKSKQLQSLQDLSAVQEEISQAKSSYRELEFAKEQMERSLNTRITGLQEELQQTLALVQTLQAKEHSLQERYQQAEANAVRAKLQADRELDALRRDLETLRQSESALRVELTAKQNAPRSRSSTAPAAPSSPLPDESAKVVELQHKIALHEREAMQLHGEIDLLQSNLDAQHELVTRLTEKAAHLEQLLSQLSLERDHTLHKLQERDAEIQRHAEESEALRSQFKNASRVDNTKQLALDEKRRQYERQVEELKAQAAAVQQERDALKHAQQLSAQRQQQQQADLMAEKSELDQNLILARRDVESLRMELSRMSVEHQDVAEQLRKSQKLAASLKRQIAEHAHSTDDSQVELLSLRELRDQLHRQIEDLQSSYDKAMDERKLVQQELLDAEERITGLTTRTEEGTQELYKAREHIRAQHERIAQLSKRVEQEINAKAAVQAALDDAVPRLQNVKGETSTLHKERGDWLELSKNLTAEVEKHKRHLKLMEREFNNKLDLSVLRQDKLKTTIAHEKATIAKLRQENQELHRTLLAYQYDLPLLGTSLNLSKTVAKPAPSSPSPSPPLAAAATAAVEVSATPERSKPLAKQPSSSETAMRHNNAVLDLKLQTMTSRVKQVDSHLDNLQSKLKSQHSSKPDGHFWM
ncbi:hypothetical protein RI367_008112 [Sorochytrium milnesiophthora]